MLTIPEILKARTDVEDCISKQDEEEIKEINNPSSAGVFFTVGFFS